MNIDKTEMEGSALPRPCLSMDLLAIIEGPPGREESHVDRPFDDAKRKAFDAGWMSAQSARVMLAKFSSRAEALGFLKEALLAGVLQSRGVFADSQRRTAVQMAFGLPEHTDFQRVPIAFDFWLNASDGDQAKWNWLTGEFSVSGSQSGEVDSYFDVEFRIAEIRGLLVEQGLVPPSKVAATTEGGVCEEPTTAIDVVTKASATAKAPKVGGRNNGKHGRPIAEVAIRLFLMDDRFARYTGQGLAEELRQAYLGHETAPPSEDNLISIASGIVTAVRKAREQQGS